MVSTADTTRTVPVDPPSAADELGKGAVAWRLAAHAAWIIALAGFIVARIGRFGFNPSDQGFVLSLAWRVVNGAIPHLDVVSPRPLGSAYLHSVDFLLPAPLFIASGFVTTVEVI